MSLVIDFCTGKYGRKYMIKLKSFQLEADNLNNLKLTTPEERFDKLRKLFANAGNNG